MFKIILFLTCQLACFTFLQKNDASTSSKSLTSYSVLCKLDGVLLNDEDEISLETEKHGILNVILLPYKKNERTNRIEIKEVTVSLIYRNKRILDQIKVSNGLDIDIKDMLEKAKPGDAIHIKITKATKIDTKGNQHQIEMPIRMSISLI